MLTRVSVVPPAGAYWPTLAIPVQQRDGSGITVEKVDGLEPVAANVTTNAYNEIDGEFFVNANVGKRNIVLHLILEATDTDSISDLRRRLYGYFLPKLPATLQFDFTDRNPVQIQAIAEDYQGDRWSNDPDAQISLICPMPNFWDYFPVVVNGDSAYGTDPPLSDVLNNGDQAVGMQLRINNDSGVDFNGDIQIDRKIESSPGVYYSVQQLYIAGVSLPASALHYVSISTNPGKKVVEIRGPDINDNDVSIQNLLGQMTEDSDWLSFYPANNKFRVVTTNTTGWSGNHLTWQLTINPQYGGV